MLLLLLTLLQQGSLSRVVVVAAALLFIAGVWLVIYFYRRYQRIEKEAEDDWDAQRSLFVNTSASKKQESASDESTIAIAPAPEVASPQDGGTRELASLSHSQPPAATIERAIVEVPAPTTEPIESAKPEPAPPVELPTEERLTQVLASPSLVEPTKKEEPEPEPAAFDEDVWAGLEVEDQTSARDRGGETIPLQAMTERPTSARVDERSHLEPFEPPRIEPLTPRDQEAATRDLHAVPSSQATARESREKPARDTIIFGTKPSERETLPLTADPVVAASGRMVEPSHAGTRSYSAPAGSILGLPAETSHRPLILGEPARPENETGIGALTNYGKDLSPKSGRGGTITLVIVLALLAGAGLAYQFVPSVHDRVSALVGRVRGVDSQVSTKQKAQIIPSYRPEVNKNMVTARGAIDNISDEPLENLEIEISLQRGADAPPDIRRIAVTPNVLAPAARGAFEFEYDGKRDTGFVGYKITRLFSNGSEIKFRTPSQK